MTNVIGVTAKKRYNFLTKVDLIDKVIEFTGIQFGTEDDEYLFKSLIDSEKWSDDKFYYEEELIDIGLKTFTEFKNQLELKLSNGSYFPIVIKYTDEDKETLIKSPDDIISGKGFKVLRTINNTMIVKDGVELKFK